MILEYPEFKAIFDEQIFEKSRPIFLEKIANSPARYIGFFRPSRPETKLLQNLTQSHEIKFGDALEIIIHEYLEKIGYTSLDHVLTFEGEELHLDQYFLGKNGDILFIEQKVRDDHDSTKKAGQIVNFEKKLKALLARHEKEKIHGYFYFVDPEFRKNSSYYNPQIERIKSSLVLDANLSYGPQLFEKLGIPQVWEEICGHLQAWKKDVKALPDINFDLDAKNSFDEIKDLDPLVFRKLFMNRRIVEEIFPVIFPQQTTLKLLLEFFKAKPGALLLYKELSQLLDAIIKVPNG